MSLGTEYAALVRDVVVAQLSDPSHGFNYQMSVVAAAQGVTAIAFDWSATSNNFFEAQIDPEDLEGSTSLRYPIATLAVTREMNSLMQMYETFSGAVQMEFKVYLSFKQSSVPRNVEKTISAVTAAVIRTFCDTSAASTGNFTGPVTFNRAIDITRPRIEMGAENWRAPIKFQFTFQLDTN